MYKLGHECRGQKWCIQLTATGGKEIDKKMVEAQDANRERYIQMPTREWAFDIITVVLLTCSLVFSAAFMNPLKHCHLRCICVENRVGTFD